MNLNKDTGPDRIRAEYELEKTLAARLLNSTKEERSSLYEQCYSELYSRFPNLLGESFESETDLDRRVRFLKKFLKADSVFLEIGPGNCALALKVAGLVKNIYAVDVHEPDTLCESIPKNFRFIRFNGRNIPLTNNSVDIIYSHQVTEHLHPDDAVEQLKSIYDSLAPGGTYICITPNRLTGPHDISKFFDTAATGLHLKEYTNAELAAAFRKAGFSKVTAYAGAKGAYLPLPLPVILFMEGILGKLRYNIRKLVLKALPLRIFLGVRLVGIK